MITRGLLDQLLKSGQDLLQNNQPARANNPSTSNQQSGGGLGDLLGLFRSEGHDCDLRVSLSGQVNRKIVGMQVVAAGKSGQFHPLLMSSE